MDVKPREVVSLVLDNGHCPFEDWLSGLRNVSFIQSVDARLTRIRAGNFGDHKSIGDGVFELRIPRGPGLRVYYGIAPGGEVVLLGGGDKSSQRRDIRKARERWRTYGK